MKNDSDCKISKKTSCSKKMLWLGRACHMIRYNLDPSGIIFYHMVPAGTIRYHPVPSGTIQYQSVQYSTIQYHLIPSCTIQYHSVQSGTIPPPSANGSIRCHSVQFWLAGYQWVPLGINLVGSVRFGKGLVSLKSARRLMATEWLTDWVTDLIIFKQYLTTFKTKLKVCISFFLGLQKN